MNPLFQALKGVSTPVQNPMGQSPSMMPMQGFNGILNRAQQLANMVQNPQQLVQRFLPDAPAEISGDPERLVEWMQQTGKATPQMVQMAQQMQRMMGGK